MFISLNDIFFRAVDVAFLHKALDGSVQAGRYSRPNDPTLYLSSSQAGVSAAMIAHTEENAPAREILSFRVMADRIFDLRDIDACKAAGIDRDQAFGDWQGCVRRGETPPSWHVADQIRQLGANGLIDPSRKAPGLWHLVLFRWNEDGAPTVKPI